MTDTVLNLGAQPRILFLCADPALMQAQMAGQRLRTAQVQQLRDDVSTDEITPVHIMSHYDQRLARFPYTGFRAGQTQPIAPAAVQAGGFSVTVAGRRYGKGSSREHSPAAEKLAGVRLVIAESFERIYAVGARILQPSCGACANCGPGSSTSASQVTVSAINRNFAGRSGPGRVWLASPPTVMASALAGELISFAALKQRSAAAARRPAA